MKMMKKLAAMILAGLMMALAGGTAAEHGNMVGKWACAESLNGQSYSCEYSFYEDGTYAYMDEAIRYEEQGEYEIQDNVLIITRADGGVEVYRLDAVGYTFYDLEEEEEGQIFAREMIQNVAMVAVVNNTYR